MAACIRPALRRGRGRGIPDPIQKLFTININWKRINQFPPDRAPRPGVVGQREMNSIGFVCLCVLCVCGGGIFCFFCFVLTRFLLACSFILSCWLVVLISIFLFFFWDFFLKER